MTAFDKYKDDGGGDFPDSWSPTEVGDVLEGQVTKVSERETKFGTRVVIQFDPARFGKGSDPSRAVEGPFEWWLKPETSSGRPSQPLAAMQEAEMDTGMWCRIELKELRDVGAGNPMKVYAVQKVDAPGDGLFD